MRVVRSSIFVLATLVALAGAACAPRTAAIGGGGGEQAAAGPKTVSVTLSDFTIAPADIQVPAGQPLEFNVTNQGPSAHTFTIVVDGQQRGTDLIQPGSSATLKVDALAAGSYDALCTVPGHEAAGMKATVTATGATGTSGTTAMASMGPTGSTGSGAAMTPQQMAAMHAAGVKAFLAGNQTSIQGNRPLTPQIVNGVKVFRLFVSRIPWEVSKGTFVNAMAFNQQVPGPLIRVRQGDRVAFDVENQLDQPFVLHFHGMTVPNSQDGVPYVTQNPIMPGQAYVYHFTIVNPPGFYIYHSHFNSTEQVGDGLYGGMIVLPRRGTWEYPTYTLDAYGRMKLGSWAKIAEEYTMILGDGPLGYVINGKSFPATTPLVAHKGDWVLIHMANLGSLLHPMHLHGYHFEVVAQDGYPLSQPYMADTLVVAPGQTFDILVHTIYPGAWAFHCHILPHVEGPQGMYGMVTALVVK